MPRPGNTGQPLRAADKERDLQMIARRAIELRPWPPHSAPSPAPRRARSLRARPASQVSASDLGNSVPRQAADSDTGLSKRSSFSSGNSSASASFGGSGGAAPAASTEIRVQSLLTSCCNPGQCSRSSSVGVQARPSGGPNKAQLFNSLASLVVVNLASHEGKPASGGGRESLEAEISGQLPLLFAEETQPRSVAVRGMQDDVARLAAQGR